MFMARSPRPTARQANIFNNKLEAARRQLDAAIRMTSVNEDELEIHTVPAAACRILRDMPNKRGRHEAAVAVGTIQRFAVAAHRRSSIARRASAA